jgi:quercetin dioxygenase-like cupin family protein
MAIPHAKPAEVIDVRPLGAQLEEAQTTTLVKTDALEVIRLVLPAGKELKPHEVPGEITVQCLEGKVVFGTEESECELTAGKLLYLAGSDEHSLRAVDDSSLLVTILLKHKAS